jgi:monovalent cation/hydrogen antiporter
MQLRPIWERLETGAARTDALFTAVAVLCVTIAARFAWVFSYHAFKRRRRPACADAGQVAPTVGSGVVVSWVGMRGIVTLAAAFAIPESLPTGAPFPNRDLILLCAFAVVLGTLLLQGLTMVPLIRCMGLTDDDPVGREVRLGRTMAYQALLESIDGDESLTAKLMRKEYGAVAELHSSHQSHRLKRCSRCQCFSPIRSKTHFTPISYQNVQIHCG